MSDRTGAVTGTCDRRPQRIETHVEKHHNVSAGHTSRFARRVAAELKAAAWKLERVLSDNGNEFKGDFTATTTTLGIAHTRIHAGRPQTNGHVETLHKTILDECWRPAFARYLYPRVAGLRRELDTDLSAHLGVGPRWSFLSSCRDPSRLCLASII
jgi:transposase InsO family protein